MEITIDSVSAQFGIGRWDRVLLVAWRGPPTLRSNELIAQAREAFEREHGKPGAILVAVSDSAKAPDGQVRQGLIEQMKLCSAKGWRISLVAEFERPFAMVVVKSALAALCFFSIVNAKANHSVGEAAADLAAGLHPSPGPGFERGVSEALGELRRRMADSPA